MANERLHFDPSKSFPEQNLGGKSENRVLTLTDQTTKEEAAIQFASNQKAKADAEIQSATNVNALFMEAVRKRNILNVNNLATAFCKSYLSFQKVTARRHTLNLDDKPAIEQDYQTFEWEMQSFASSVSFAESGIALLSQLHQQFENALDDAIIYQMPKWTKIPVRELSHELGQPKKLSEIFGVYDILSSEARKKIGDDTESVDQYKRVAELLTHLLQTNASPTLTNFLKTFLLAPKNEALSVLKRHSAESKEKSLATQLYLLFENIIMQTYGSLMDDDDPRHEDAVKLLNSLVHTTSLTLNEDEWYEFIARGAALRGVHLDLDIASLYRSVTIIAADSPNPLYSNIAAHIRVFFENQTDMIVITKDAMRKYFDPEDKEDPVDWDEVRTNVEKLKLSHKSTQLLDVGVSGLKIPTERLTTQAKKIDDVIYFQIFFVHDSNAVENYSPSEPLKAAGFTEMTVALDLFMDPPKIYLRVIDDEREDEFLENCFAGIVANILKLNAKKITSNRQESKTQSKEYTNPISVHKIKPKGPEQMKSPKTARSQRDKNAHALENAPHSFEEQILQSRYRPQFEFPLNFVSSKAEVSPSRLKATLDRANRGGCVVKVYSRIAGPNPGNPVWAIRYDKNFRILAQENGLEGNASVFAIVSHRELEALYMKK